MFFRATWDALHFENFAMASLPSFARPLLSNPIHPSSGSNNSSLLGLHISLQ